MAGYTPLQTRDSDYAIPEQRILRADSRRVESPLDLEASRAIPSRSNTVGSTLSAHESLLEKGLKRESTRWSTSGSTIFGVDTESIRHSIRPQYHEEPNPLDTARPFIHHRQAWRLSRLAISEFLITLVLCISLYLVLKYYEQRETLPMGARQQFNTFITIFALLLGINLAASLRSYAKLLRWRLLSYTYRPLRTFDLILGCDSLMNVVKLMFIDRNEAYPYLPSMTQVFSGLWLFLNLALAVAIGTLALSFNLEPVTYSDLTAPGPALIPDLSAVLTWNYWRSLSMLQSRGAGSFGLYYDYMESLAHSLDIGYGRFNSLNNGTSLVYFPAVTPDYQASTLSRIYIQNDVVCNFHNVTEGALGQYTYVVYTNDAGLPVNITIPGYAPAQAGIVAMSNFNSSCGPTCTEIDMFVAGVNTSDPTWGYYDAGYYKCKSTISPILEDPLDDSDTTTQPPDIQLPDTISRMLAGSIGWSDSPYVTNASGNTTMYQTYYINSGSWIRPDPKAEWGGANPNPSITEQIQDYISCFNMAAIVSASSILPGSVGYQTRFLEDAPTLGIELDVYWTWTLILLFGMPVGQLIVLVVVLMLANNTIIRDDSHLAISKIYFNLLKKYDLGDKGCMLHAEELVKLMDTRVAYTWRDLPDHERNGRPVGHVEVFEQPEFRFKISSGNGKGFSSRPEKTTWPQDKYYD